MTNATIGPQVLLDMNNLILDQEDGYWIKIQAWEVQVSRDVPHGVRYALTLHAPSGKRLMGFDNAHALKLRGLKFSGQRFPFDHQHRFVSDQAIPYAFTSIFQLITDFFEEADWILIEVKKK